MISSRCLLKMELFSFISISPSFRLSLLSLELLYDFISPLIVKNKTIKTYNRQIESMILSRVMGIVFVMDSISSHSGLNNFHRTSMKMIHTSGFHNNPQGFV